MPIQKTKFTIGHAQKTGLLFPNKVVDGAPILMRDVGEVRDSGQIQTNVVRINGTRQVYIPIYRQPGAFGGSVVLLSLTGRELFPPVDSGQFTIYVRLPSGTRIERTESTIHRIEQTVVGLLGRNRSRGTRHSERSEESRLRCDLTRDSSLCSE